MLKQLVYSSDGRPTPAGSRWGDASARIAEGHNAWQTVLRYAAGTEIDSSGDFVSATVLSGWACEAQVSETGRRQIFSVLLPGDALFLPGRGQGPDYGITALTRLEITAPRLPVDLADAEGLALTEGLLQQSRRLCDHIVRLGSLTAQERTIDLLLELHLRLSALRLVKDNGFRVPLTQEAFGELLGLSVVHMNRTLSLLRREGLISVRSGSITLHDMDQLSARCRRRLS